MSGYGLANMILRRNLPRLIEIAHGSKRVLDVGGWHNPFNPATHVLDLNEHATRRICDSLTPGEAERFTKDTWVVMDVCKGGWPYADDWFDFAICSHLLEDVRDPLTVCRELSRVAKRGYIEVPSRAREIYSKAWMFHLRAGLGRMPEVGFYHHRWYVEHTAPNHLVFLRKTQQAVMRREFYITRAELGGKLSEAESGLCLWWKGEVTAEERFALGNDDLSAFKRRTLERHRRPWWKLLSLARD